MSAEAFEVGTNGRAEVELGSGSVKDKWVISAWLGGDILMNCGPIVQTMTLEQLAQFAVALANVGKYFERRMVQQGIRQPHCVETASDAVTQNAAVTGHCP